MAKKFYGGIDLENQSILSLFDSDSSNKVGLLAPATISSDFDLTLPASISTADDVMLADASGNLSFGKIANANVDASAAIAYSKLNLAGSIVNADINASAAIVYSKLSLSDSIVNADINTAAAIAYSKLNLTGNIVDADINASANIAQSKLNLSITNSEVNASAAIAYSKLALSDSIVNADINSSAAIAYSKLNLTGSVVDADLASGINATKIGGGTVDNTEFGHLNGVTSSIQTQIDNLSSSIQNFEWQESVIDKDLTAPPGGESAGDRYLIGLDTTASVATGAWAGQDGNIAEYNGASWVFTTPTTGMFISADDEGDKLYSFGGTVWTAKYFEATTASTGLTKVGFDIRLDATSAGAGIGFSSGVLSVNVDDSTIEVSTDTLQLKDGGVTDAKLAAGIALDKLAPLTGSRVPVTTAGGVIEASNVTTLELARLIGITGPIQGQIDGKQADVITTAGDLVVGDGSGDASRLAAGSEGQVLKIVGGSVAWAADSGVTSSKTDWITADGTSKVINHNLGTSDVIVQVYDKANGETIEIDAVDRTDANNVTVTASVAPNASGWRVMILEV